MFTDDSEETIVGRMISDIYAELDMMKTVDDPEMILDSLRYLKTNSDRITRTVLDQSEGLDILLQKMRNCGTGNVTNFIMGNLLHHWRDIARGKVHSVPNCSIVPDGESTCIAVDPGTVPAAA